MSQHIIRQQIVEINAVDKSNSQDIFNEISRLFNNRAKDVTGYIFDKYVGDDILLKIDALEIDIGVIDFPFSEENFVKVYSEKLEEAIAQMLKKKEYSAQIQAADEVSITPSLIQLLEQFLLTGTIAWWVNAEELKDPEYVFRKLQENDEARLKTMITNIFAERIVRKRLVYSFKEEYIRSVIRFIKPDEEEFIYQYHSEVSHLQLETNLVQIENTAFRKELWLFILDFLADKAGSHFNRKMFVRYTIKSIADRFNVNLEQVLFYLTEATKVVQGHFKRTENLVSIIEEISIEIEKEKFNSVQIRKETPYVVGIDMQQEHKYPLFFFLVNGFLPLNNKNAEYVPEAKLINEIRANQSFTRFFFSKYGKLQGVRNRLINNFGEAAVRSVITIVEPASAETILTYTDYTNSFQRKTNFIKAEEKVFRQSLWEFILSYLFSEMGSVFNAKMFLISNIQTLARHYNLDYRKLLAILVQGVGQTMSVTSSQPGLFYLLTEILSETKELVSDEENTVHRVGGAKAVSDDIASDDIEINRSPIDQLMEDSVLQVKPLNPVYLTNLFLHILEHGEFPWWLEQTKYSAEDIIKKLIKLHPAELKSSLIYTAKTGKIGIAFLEKYSSFFLSDFISLFDKSGLYKNVYSYVLNLVSANKSFIPGDVVFIKALLASQNFSTSNSLDLVAFFESVFEQLKSTGNIAWETIIIPESFIPNESDRKKIHDAVEMVSQEFIPVLKGGQFTYSEKNFEFLIKQIAAKSGTKNYSEVIQLIPNWIREFLKSGTIAENIGHSFFLSQSAFIVWAMEFLFNTNKETLYELLSSKNITLENQITLLKLITNIGFESGVRIFVENQLQEQFHKSESVYLSATDPISWRKIVGDLQSGEMSQQTKLLWSTVLGMQSARSLAIQFIDDKSIEILFKQFDKPKLVIAYKTFLDVLLSATNDHFERAQLRKWILEFFLLILMEPHIYFSDSILAKRFAIFITGKLNLNDKSLYLKLKKLGEDRMKVLSDDHKALNSELFKQILLHRAQTEEVEKFEKKIMAEETELGRFLDKDEGKKLEQELIELLERKEENKNMLLNGEQIYVANAGMVLLHPFIPTLFSRAGLMNDGSFKDEHSRSKAALLLQYAVSGKEGSLEHDLVLNKILVGMEVEEVVDISIKLSEDDKDLINGMIKAIMLQWDKMKNTSFEGFMNSFLLREGYVYQTDEAWILRVEQRAYDILLQTLPWGFGMIRFSWMKKTINIEWT